MRRKKPIPIRMEQALIRMAKVQQTQARLNPKTPIEGLPFDYVMSCSTEGLQSYEMNELSIAANLQKQIDEMASERDRHKVRADIARFLLNWRDELLSRAGDHLKVAEATTRALTVPGHAPQVDEKP